MATPKSVDSGFTVEEKAASDAKDRKGRKQATAIFWIVAGLITLGVTSGDSAPYLTGAEASYQTTVGTITGTDYGRRGRCTVELDFTVDGKVYKTSQRAQRDHCDNTVGKHMNLRYDPKDIQGTVTDNTPEGSRLFALGSLTLSLTMTGIGVFLFRRAGRIKVAQEADDSPTTKP